MSNIDKQALREAAEKATPGPWYVHDKPCEDGNYGIDTSDKEFLAEAVVWWGFSRQSIWREEDAKHIAAANPATVLALLDELEAKEEQRANWFQMAEKLGADLDAAEKRIAELEAREVKLPQRQEPTSSGHYGEGYLVPSDTGSALEYEDTVEALAAAGITVKGE